jgi:hypothetical protein
VGRLVTRCAVRGGCRPSGAMGAVTAAAPAGDPLMGTGGAFLVAAFAASSFGVEYPRMSGVTVAANLVSAWRRAPLFLMTAGAGGSE